MLDTYGIIKYIPVPLSKIDLNKGFLAMYKLTQKVQSEILACIVACLNSFLQMMVVWQNLHQKVKLKSLGLKDDKKNLTCLQHQSNTSNSHF